MIAKKNKMNLIKKEKEKRLVTLPCYRVTIQGTL